jgi:ketol-acid reductoisomerase
VKVYYQKDAEPGALSSETVGVLGYGIQGRAQALTLRDSGVRVLVGNREDGFRAQARADGFEVRELSDAVGESTVVLVLLPDEVQPEVYRRVIAPALAPGKALVFAHGFAIHYRLVEPDPEVDVLLLAPRMPGQFLRRRFLEGWGVPAFIGVHQDASGGAWRRLLALAGALGVLRCGAFEASFAQETELDHFSEHFTYPVVFKTLEVGFEALVEAGYPPELALMELHGSEELGQVLLAAGREGLFGMIASHASPACQVGIAHYWDRLPVPERELRRRAAEVLDDLRDGQFARHLLGEASRSYPELAAWRKSRSSALSDAERRLRSLMKEAPALDQEKEP